MHIITVCTANICRSPFAQLLLQDRLGADVTVTSGGVRALVGEEMDPRSRAALAERGVDGPVLNEFRASALDAARVSAADLVLTATTTHRDAVVRMTPRALKRTFTLREFAALAPAVGADSASDLVAAVARARTRMTGRADVTDPVGLDFAGYAVVMDELDAVVQQVTDRLLPLLPGSGGL